LLIKGLVNLFKKPSYTPDYNNYDYTQNEIQEDYSAPVEKPEEKNLIENFGIWWDESIGKMENFFDSENETGGKNPFWGKGSTKEFETKDELFFGGEPKTYYEIPVTEREANTIDSIVNKQGLRGWWEYQSKEAEKVWGESKDKTEKTRKTLAYILGQQIPGGAIAIQGDKIVQQGGKGEWWDEQSKKAHVIFGDQGDLENSKSIFDPDAKYSPETKFQKNMKTLLYTISENLPGASQILQGIEMGIKVDEKVEKNFW